VCHRHPVNRYRIPGPRVYRRCALRSDAPTRLVVDLPSRAVVGWSDPSRQTGKPEGESRCRRYSESCPPTRLLRPSRSSTTGFRGLAAARRSHLKRPASSMLRSTRRTSPRGPTSRTT
jgi:hypothetical protein